jgi:hypothetical protein
MYERTLRKFDSRIVQRHIARKVVSKKEHQTFVSALEDCAELAGESTVDFVASNQQAEAEPKPSR